MKLSRAKKVPQAKKTLGSLSITLLYNFSSNLSWLAFVFYCTERVTNRITSTTVMEKTRISRAVFFSPKPEGKKKTVKLPRTYLFFWSTDTFVCDYLKKK